MRTSTNVVAAAALAGMCCAMSACGSRSTATDATAPIVTSPSAPSPAATTWDFAQLAGADGPRGNPAIFTISGQGSIVATVIDSEPNQGFQVWSKGFADAPLSDERGLGLCGDYGTGGACGNASPTGSDEIGDVFPDSAGNLTLTPSLVLNFTGLAAGSVVDSVALGSLGPGEGYSVEWSADGVSYSLMASGARSGGTSAVISLPVHAGANYLRFDQGAGVAGSNYVVETVHVILPSP